MKKTAKYAEKDEQEYILSLLNKNIDILRQMKENHAPKHPDEPFHLLFAENASIWSSTSMYLMCSVSATRQTLKLP